MRHKSRLFTAAALAGLVLAALYVGLTVDIFANGGRRSPEARTLEIDELLLVSAVLFGGLALAVRRLLRERREQEARRAAEQEIRRLAFHDPLTGLANRRQFDDALKAAASALPRLGASHALLMLDLNGFKRVNDVFGHGAGDEVLIHVAGRLSKAVRQGDLVARLGGDEFAVLATQLSGPEAATGVALRIIEELEPVIPAGGAKQAIRSAIGIALMPQDATEPGELLRKADIALYRAKEQRHSVMRFFEPEMDTRVKERAWMESELRHALESGDIRPFYQPIVDMRSGEICEFEALARWEHPKLGPISPGRFIPIAEDSGLIGALTDALLETACRDAATWPGEVRMAFNVSPALLQDPGFGLKVLALLARTGLSPDRLELEITESALVRDLEAAQRLLGGLRQAGVRIALDDFGTGYSSLYHLRNFKVDKIKIDRSFIDSMGADQDSAAIVRALIGLGSGLGLEVTAEGVETEQQREQLAADGCGQAQGYLYSAAVGAEDALGMVSPRAAARAIS